ncbi:hypothetical protein D2M30_2336 [Bacillus amyloliquefaciens]|nr:hypothetical protein D2M30_2336 [Bacillus amyloliquefaciens]
MSGFFLFFFFLNHILISTSSVNIGNEVDMFNIDILKYNM